MAKLVLDNELLAEAYFEEACLFGIMAPIPDYQFCGLLQEQMGFSFFLDPASEIILKKKERNYYFSVFKYLEPNSSVEHYLYNNKWDGGLLLPEFKHLDFIWLIHGLDACGLQVGQLMQAIKNIGGVQLITELTNQKIKSRQNLIL